MKNWKQLVLIVVLSVFVASFFTAAQVPTKLFDVRNGNGMTIDAVTYNRATAIIYRDNAAKNKVEDAFAVAYGYQATIPDPQNPGQTIPNPQGKQAFMNRKLTEYIRDIVRSEEIKLAAKTASDSAATAIDADLP